MKNPWKYFTFCLLIWVLSVRGEMLSLPAQYAVIIDTLGESVILYPDEKNSYRIPGETGAMLLLSENGDNMELICWRGTGDILLESDGQKSFTAIHPDGVKNEDIQRKSFSGKGIWYAFIQSPEAWDVPFAADFRMVMPMAFGVLPFEQDTFIEWPIAVKAESAAIHIADGIVITGKSNWTAWTSGFGAYAYPFTIDPQKKVTFREFTPHSNEQSIRSKTRPTIIFWWSNPAESWQQVPLEKFKTPAPGQQMQRWISEKQTPSKRHPFLATAIPTCGGTETLERYFYDDNPEENRQAMEQMIQNINTFVAMMRQLLDGTRTALPEIEKELDDSPELKKEFSAALQFINTKYGQIHPKLGSVDDCSKQLQGFLNLADDRNLSPEAKEDQAKSLGRQIRTMGGQQDHLAANCRLTVKGIRQKAIQLLSLNPNLSTQKKLRNILKITEKALRQRGGLDGK